MIVLMFSVVFEVNVWEIQAYNYLCIRTRAFVNRSVHNICELYCQEGVSVSEYPILK